jgi:short-subunit dehydrogenase
VDVNPRIAEVAAETGARYLVADLSDRHQLDEVAAWARDIDVVINNAGVAAKAPFHEMDPLRAEAIVATNVRAPVVLTRTYLARFRQRGSGTIVNVSSSTTYFPTPGMAPYGASKAFLTSFTEALVAETRDVPGIRVLGVCPSGMATDFQRASGVRNERPDRLLDPARVASWIFDDIARGRRGIRDYGAATHVFRVLRGVLPRGMFLPLIDRLMRKYR